MKTINEFLPSISLQFHSKGEWEMETGFRKLEIYRRAHALAIGIRAMTLRLPRFEMYEEGRQIRRSSKSTSSNIVEGYCLRRCKNEWILYLTRAHASTAETLEHLDCLFETHSLEDESVYQKLHSDGESLSRMLFNFIQSIIKAHRNPNTIAEGPFSYSAYCDPTFMSHSLDPNPVAYNSHSGSCDPLLTSPIPDPSPISKPDTP